MTERVLRGVAAAPGVGIGTVVRYTREHRVADARVMTERDVQHEVERLADAIERVRAGIDVARRITAERVGEDEAALFDAHSMMLDDPAFTGEARRLIVEHNEPASRAVEQTAERIVQMFQEIEDEYLRERAADVRDVANQVVLALREQQTANRIELPADAIVVADELFPSDTFRLDIKHLAGLVTQRGSRTAHVAILARALKIPTVVAVQGVMDNVGNDESAIVDGDRGTLILSPSADSLSRAKVRIEQIAADRDRLAALVNVPAVTTDGAEVALYANIGTQAEVHGALEYGAEGIGLFRTEFLFEDRPEPPSEAEQIDAYRQVVGAMGDRPVIIRTLDAGGDKPVAGITDQYLSSEPNPFLGRRGLRLSLEHPDLFRTQIRAILRVATSGNVWMMFPMVTTLWELRDARRLVDEVAAELRSDDVDHRRDLPIGIMVEVPAAALNADILIREADFFSIGTNDLAQYTLAVDRTNPDLAARYNPLDPAVLTLIDMATKAANRQDKHIAVCGELAGDPRAIPILIGLGIRELSMTGSSIPAAKETIRSLNAEEASEAARRLMQGLDFLGLPGSPRRLATPLNGKSSSTEEGTPDERSGTDEIDHGSTRQP